MGLLPLGAILGVLVVTSLQEVACRRHRGASLPVPTSETIPYVAEVMGAATYEETLEEEDDSLMKSRRVQRKLTEPEHTDKDLDPEQLEYTEYQGVMGRPGVDFPVLPKIPRTAFSCRKVKSSGYYADLETGCQVFHICDGGRKISFLCPNGTIFRQSHLICDWWFRVDCERSVEQYEESAEQLAHDQMVYKKRAEEIARALAAKQQAQSGESRQTVGNNNNNSNIRSSRRKEQRPNFSNSLDGERQITAETASFNSNRHRFSNQVEQESFNGASSTAAPVPQYTTSTSAYNADNTQRNYNFNGQSNFQIRVMPQQVSSTASPQFNNSANLQNSQLETKTNYNSHRDYNQQYIANQQQVTKQSLTTKQGVVTSPQQAQQAVTNQFDSSSYKQTSGTNQQTTSNRVHQTSYQQGTNQQTTSNRVHQTGYQQGTNQQTTSNRVHQTSYQQGTNQQPQSSSSQLASNQQVSSQENNNQFYSNHNNNYNNAAGQLQTSQQVKSAADQNYNNYGNSEIQAKYQSQPENLNNNNNGQAYQSQTFNSNGVPQYQTTKKPEVNEKINNFKSTVSVKPTYQTTPQPVINHQQSTHSVNNYKTIVPQYQTTNQPELLLNIKNHETLSTYQQLQTTSKPFVNEVSKSSDFTLQNDSPTPGLNDPLRGSSIKPAGSTYATIKLQENYQTNPTVAPITRSNNDLNQNSQTSPDILQSINSLSTPLVASTSAPQYRQTGPHNTVFTVKVKPETKDYSFLELHRQYNDVNRVTTPVPPVTTPYFSGTSVTITPSIETYFYSTIPSSPNSSTFSQRNKNLAYIPNHSTQPKSQQASSYQPDSVPNQYASYNDSGRKEEIRPELINSLIDGTFTQKSPKLLKSSDNGVTPTSAKALHSLASYYGSVESLEDTSSTSLNNLGTASPQVPDVVLNFHSGEKDESGFNDESTLTPLTSTHSLDKLPSILTKQTKDSYLHLFSDSKEQQYEHYNDNDEDDDLIAKQSGRLVGKKTTTTTSTTQKPRTVTEEELVEQDLEELDADEKQSKFRDSSELRELAQVFSRALSAYLEDPDTFKEILAQVRPTEPNLDVTTPSPEDEVLDFSDAHRENRGKSTVAPKTTILDTPVDIDQINSLVSNVKIDTSDNSIENFSISSLSQFESIKKQTTVKPTSSAYVNNNGGTKTTTPSGRYIGSSDTSSYFPTAGSVSDTTRPRYGGFHNNTRRLPKNYSPYGAGLPTNITGIPLKLVSTTAAPFINSINYTDFKIPLRVISEAHRVNSLLTNNNILFNSNSFSASSEEASESFKSNDNEKLLIPSSSQSLVTSGNNYLKFAQNFHQANKQIHSKDSRNEQVENFSINHEFNQQELLPYFGQQPPFESFDEPTGFQTQNPKLDVEANFIPAVNLSHHRESKFNHNISDETDRSMPVTEREGDFKVTNYNVNATDEVGTTWTTSANIETTYTFETTSLNHTQVYPDATTILQATTYHPLHSSSEQPLSTINTEPTTMTPDVTYTQNEFETTLDNEKISSQTTFGPDHPNYNNLIKERAKEMFGMLNETTAGMLMNMINQAESNITIRRLVLLLVADNSKENKTAEESRFSLIRALLNNEGVSSESTEATTTTAPTTTTTSVPTTTVTEETVTPAVTERKKSRLGRIRTNGRRVIQGSNWRAHSSKSYRGTDSQTAVAGGKLQSAELNNKINSAKLYIPSASSSSSAKLPYDSDARAVELLKTLYTLAAKWG